MSAESYVLMRFLRSSPVSLLPLGSAGGFSGAAIWEVGGLSGSWCLKAWPVGTRREQLEDIHRWMRQAREAGLQYVPTVALTIDGITVVEAAGRIWDLCEWMPGHADFHSRHTTARIEAACAALARLHLVWRTGERTVAEPPSVKRRIQTATEWLGLINSGWRPLFAPANSDPVTDPAQAAWAILPALVPTVAAALAPCVGRRLPLHPCLCDIWGDHILYTGDEVTGIIDYGSMRLDHPAVDLARMLGDVASRDPGLYDAGFAAYARFAPLSPDDALLVRALDRTGTILAAARWLTRLYRDHEPFHNRERVAGRLTDIVDRLAPEGPGFRP